MDGYPSRGRFPEGTRKSAPERALGPRGPGKSAIFFLQKSPAKEGKTERGNTFLKKTIAGGGLTR